jgi:hypothetical protein
MNLKQFIEKAQIDWENVSVEPDSGPLDSDCPFDLVPQDFITFAKADLFTKDMRGLINALSNAKRAIDCQADSFITCLGLDPEDLSKQLGQIGIAELKQDVQPPNDSPLKFRFLAALGVATPAIISRMRRLRNILEHEYRQPKRRDVCDAIDVAELIIQASDGHLRSAWQMFSIGSGSTTVRGLGIEESEVHVSLSYQPKPSARFEVRMLDLQNVSQTKKWESKSDTLKPGQVGFVSALKLLLRSDINRDLRAELSQFLTEVGVIHPRQRLGRKRK